MTQQHIAAIPAAGLDCARFAPLLPLVAHADQGLLPDAQATVVRAHVTDCSHCRAVLAGYNRVERALHLIGAADAADRRHMREDIIQSIEEREQPPASATPVPAVAALPGRLHRLLSRTGAIAAVLLISLFASALFAGHAALFGRTRVEGPPRWPPSPTPRTFSPSYVLSAIVPGGSNGTWLLGMYTDALCSQHLHERELTPQPTGQSTGMATPDPACAEHPLLLRWDRQQWHRVSANVPASYNMYWQMSALPSGEAFATNGSSMLHLRNGTWSVDPSYAFPQKWIGAGACSCVNIESLDMVSPQEGWAAGGFVSPGAAPKIAHYRDGEWTLESVPDMLTGSYFHSISMASPDEGWAVGYQADNTETFTEHYHNGQWTRVDPVHTGGSNAGQVIPGSLNAVQTLPDGEAWAVGELNPSFGPGLILHWVNGTWNIVDTGIQQNILHAVTMVSPTEGWVTGDGNEILHLHEGVWTKEGTTVHGFATNQVMMNSPREGWAIGAKVSFDPSDGSVLHYQDGVWTSTTFSTVLAQALTG